MLVKPGEHIHLARLLHFMVLGEQLAHDCAKAQIQLTSNVGIKKFLTGQARQEGYHATIFKWAMRWLSPKASQDTSVCKPMNQYRRCLESAIGRKDFAETLLAEQIILEGLGDAILKKLEVGLVKRGAPFQRLRRTLIHQEEAHHAFGLRTLNRILAREEESLETLRQRAQLYLPLAKIMILSAQDAFLAIDEDPYEYLDDFHRDLPPWLQPTHEKANRASSSLYAVA